MKRPRIKPEYTKGDRVFEIISWVFLLMFWGMVLCSYESLPDIIPTHYNASGNGDGFGEKRMILMLPLVATILFVAISLLNRFPYLFNYPTHITEENAYRQYTNATRMLRCLNFMLVIIFGLIAFKTIQNAHSGNNDLGPYFSLLVVALAFFPMIYFLVKSRQVKQRLE